MASCSLNYYNSHDFDMVIALSAAAAVRAEEPPVWRRPVFLNLGRYRTCSII